MINTNELKGIIVKNEMTQARLAVMLGITPKTFYSKMKSGVFGSDEIQLMIEILHIENAMEVFFAQKVS